MFRKRVIMTMASETGIPASGDATQTQACNVEVSCEPTQDCLFSDWSEWSACTLSCNGIKRRSRQIAQYGSGSGKFCEAALKEISQCNPSPDGATPEECAKDPPVDCVLG